MLNENPQSWLDLETVSQTIQGILKLKRDKPEFDVDHSFLQTQMNFYQEIFALLLDNNQVRCKNLLNSETEIEAISPLAELVKLNLSALESENLILKDLVIEVPQKDLILPSKLQSLVLDNCHLLHNWDLSEYPNLQTISFQNSILHNLKYSNQQKIEFSNCKFKEEEDLLEFIPKDLAIESIFDLSYLEDLSLDSIDVRALPGSPLFMAENLFRKFKEQKLVIQRDGNLILVAEDRMVYENPDLNPYFDLIQGKKKEDLKTLDFNDFPQVRIVEATNNPYLMSLILGKEISEAYLKNCDKLFYLGNLDSPNLKIINVQGTQLKELFISPENYERYQQGDLKIIKDRNQKLVTEERGFLENKTHPETYAYLSLEDSIRGAMFFWSKGWRSRANRIRGVQRNLRYPVEDYQKIIEKMKTGDSSSESLMQDFITHLPTEVLDLILKEFWNFKDYSALQWLRRILFLSLRQIAEELNHDSRSSLYRRERYQEIWDLLLKNRVLELNLRDQYWQEGQISTDDLKMQNRDDTQYFKNGIYPLLFSPEEI
ncbi:MAG TPA: hypothetical protein PLQ36_01520 [Candidatus Gracilibacteria bacterium]|nr:hypothetical protein [Candidatus Gracilibacteria bacterium]